MKHRRLKRMGAACMAAVMLASSGILSTPMQAADQYYIKFEAADSETTTVIEGDNVNAIAKLPPSYDFIKDKPFAISVGGNDVTDENFVSVTGSGSIYNIVATQNSASVGSDGKPIAGAEPNKSSSTTYVMDARFLAMLTEGEGAANRPPIGAANPDDKGDYYPLSVLMTNGKMGVTVNSSFTFKSETDEVDGAVRFSKISSATGEFIDFGPSTPGGTDGSEVVADQIQKDSGGRFVPITIKARNNAERTYKYKVYLKTNKEIKENTTFKIEFNLRRITPLNLTVVTPKRAVDDVAVSIFRNPTDPNATDSFKIPYIKLSGGDTLNSISTRDFQVLTRVGKYNSNVDISWKWVPEINDDIHQKVVQPGKVGAKTQMMTTVPLEEDVKGSLVATATYDLKMTYPGISYKQVSTEAAAIPIIILGTGVPPRLEPLTETSAFTNAPVNINKLPTDMDVYDGSVVGYPAKPKDPYTFSSEMYFGEGRGRAEKAVITASGVTPDAVSVYVDKNRIAYDYGTDIMNLDLLAGHRTLDIVAKKRGQVLLTIDFYIRNNKNQLVKSETPIKIPLTINDSTPRDIATLETLTIKCSTKAFTDIYKDGEIPFGYKPEVNGYTILVPNKADKITLTPVLPKDSGASEDIALSIDGVNTVVKSGSTTVEIPLDVEIKKKIELTVTAENGRKNRYTLDVTRLKEDRDATLKLFGVYDSDRQDAPNLITDFKPETKQYNIEVPYKTKWVRMSAIATSPWVVPFTKDSYTPPLIKRDGFTKILDGNEWVRLNHPKDPGSLIPGSVTPVSLKVIAEDASVASTYAVNITRRDPSDNNLISQLSVTNKKNVEYPFTDEQKFAKEEKEYYVAIPYSAQELRIHAMPDDALGAQNIFLTLPDGTKKELEYTGSSKPLVFDLNTPPKDAYEKEFVILVTATAESGLETIPPYSIRVTRNPPDPECSLIALDLFDQNDKPVPTMAFNPETLNYEVAVPFETEKVKVVPKAKSPLSTVEVNGKKMTENTTYYTTALKANEKTVVTVVVTAESGQAQTYTLTISRSAASDDARLKQLTVTGGEDFKPLFVPSKTSYSVRIPMGTKGISLTPTTNHPGATMKIDGNKALSGVASAVIEPVEANSKVVIEVTAQDGKTKMNYTISVTNENLIEKSNNADLSRLDVTEGAMSPKFKAAVTNYEVAVKDETASVDIIPVPANKGATMKVFSGSKELGDNSGNYSEAIVDGENEFSIEVTSEDGKVKKTYAVSVFRKDEEKQGVLKPITEDMIDYESSDVIVVDISKYTIISASVFNKLKEYPEKSIIFQGNDYSIQINAKDITKIIPHTTVYDLSLSFSSPNEEAIYDLIDKREGNEKLKPVFVHFNHHGELPANVTLTLSLGRKYRNTEAAWSYYNEERDRIDYYGDVTTNSQGTFSVELTHMSTYIWSRDRIIGSESKVTGSGNLSVDAANPNKVNPGTGEDGGER